ncbi:MAG: hypothetical protein ACI9UA_006068 [Pseudoalteromonas tetraodonis]
MNFPQQRKEPLLMGVNLVVRLVLVLVVTLVLPSAALATETPSVGEEPVRIYVVGHGWHTGLVVPNETDLLKECPALGRFAGWEFVEIGWGDEGFYRGGTSISLDVALKAVATPTPTVLHAAGVSAPVEMFFPNSEIIAIDISAMQFADLARFVGATFKTENGAPIDLGEGIYSDSRFFRAHGSYYFPNTCNVWTLKAIKSAGLPVFSPAGIRAENVITQAAQHGETIRRYQGRSRVSVLIAAVVAIAVVAGLRKIRGLVWWAWGALIFTTLSLAAVTMANVNQVGIPAFLPAAAACACWAVVAAIAATHMVALRRKFRWRHAIVAAIASLVILIGLSPL